MTAPLVFPDGEDGVADLLETIDGLGIYFRTPDFSIDEPDEYEAHVPFAVVSILDGASNDQGWEQTEVVEVQTFAKTRTDAKQLNQAVRAVLACPDGVRVDSGYFDRITMALLPNQVPYEQEDVRRDISNWALVSRKQVRE